MGVKFTETAHCKSRTHCFDCRNNDRFRVGMERIFGAFVCPIGLPIPCDVALLPEEAVIPERVAVPPEPCAFANPTNMPWCSARPCMGRKIECNHPDNAIGVVPESSCNETKCRFFKEKPDA